MTDEGTSGQQEATGEPVAADGRTVAEVEQEWRKRISGKDTAHAAEKQQWESLLTQMRTDLAKAQSEATTKMTDIETLQKQYAELQKELESERKGRTIDTRKANYPQAAGVLPEDILGTMADDALTALEQRLTAAAQPGAEPPKAPSAPVLPNTAPRSPAEPPREPTSGDLKALLKEQAPGWLEQFRP